MKEKLPAVDRYFLTDPCPLSKKRQFKVKAAKIAFIVAIILAVIGLIAFGESPPTSSGSSGPQRMSERSGTQNGPTRSPLVTLPTADFVATGYAGSYQGSSTPSGSGSTRSFGAAQLVQRSSGGQGGADSLPLGTLVPVVLQNGVVSSDQSTPVIAGVTSDAIGGDGLAIPEGTKAYGQATLDSSSDRIQVRFQNLVLPDGSQRDISAVAMDADGAAGLAGEVDRQLLARNGGRVAGTFVGGLAEGMKDRKTGPDGIVLESGSIRNGLLNGVASTALDQARDSSSDASRLKPVVSVAKGRTFYLFLEKGYSG